MRQFYPTKELNQDVSNWWSPNIECLRLMLETTGFRAQFLSSFGQRAAFKAHPLDLTPHERRFWAPAI